MEVRKDHALLLPLVFSSLGILFIYLVSIGHHTAYLELKNLNEGMAGMVVSTGGRINDVAFNPAGHVFIGITDGHMSVRVAIFNSIFDSTSDVGTYAKHFSKGRQLNVTGVLDVNEGWLQIAPRKVDDLKLS